MVKSAHASKTFVTTFNSTGSSESDASDMPDGRQNSTEYDPLDNYLSDDEGKMEISIKVTNENGQSVKVV